MSVRVGIGYDSHRLVEGRPLIIGGVEIEFERGLAGHSDADVLAHAVTDAVLGAAGAGDIGTHFPPTDERWRDADSIELLRTVVAALEGRVVNVDATVICERPPIGPHREAIEARLGAGARRARYRSRRPRTRGSVRSAGRRGSPRSPSPPSSLIPPHPRTANRLGFILSGAVREHHGDDRGGHPQRQDRTARQPRRPAVQPEGARRGGDHQADGARGAARRRPGAAPLGRVPGRRDRLRGRAPARRRRADRRARCGSPSASSTGARTRSLGR